MKQLKINALKGLAALAAGCIFVVYVGIKTQTYLKLEIYDGEIPDNIHLILDCIVIGLIILLARWTAYKPIIVIQREKDEQITRMGIMAAEPKPKSKPTE
jgi:hypothetical protein